MPDRILIFKYEKYSGGEHNKEQLVLLLAINMTSTDKLKPLIVEKSKKPMCFVDVKSFPIDYIVNKKAWMTNE